MLTPATRMPMPTVVVDHAIPPYSCSQKWPTMPAIPMTTSTNAV